MRAFSLVELSIVLVILGLLTGGILAGQSLIRAAELRAVTSELSRYHVALRSFQSKYMMLPGDITNATQFWGTATTCPGTVAEPSTDARTCDGNGDGLIGSTGATRYERFRAWQQMANAGLIEGSYTGVPGAQGNVHAVVGQNIPASKLALAGWNVLSDATSKLQIGATLASNNTAYGPVMRPEEAWNIDLKMDDGLPTSGKTTGNCFDAATPPAYNLTDASIACSLVFNVLQ